MFIFLKENKEVHNILKLIPTLYFYSNLGCSFFDFTIWLGFNLIDGNNLIFK